MQNLLRGLFQDIPVIFCYDWGMKNNFNKLISLKDKIALITGSSSGIGRETAKIFAKAGAHLILVDINRDGLKEVKEEISGNGRRVEIFTLDLAEKEQIDGLWKKIKNKPDILINDAGIYPFQDYLRVDEKSLKKVLDINLNSMFWTCQHFIRQRGKRGGIIVNISSIEAILPFKKDLIPYSISKSGVISLTRSIARDYGKNGFRANVVLPGAIKTAGTRKHVKEALKKLQIKLMKVGYLFNQRLALGRWGMPEEVARVILFLSSDLSSYVQGAIIPVDGGFLST